MARELSRRKVDVACLQETKWREATRREIGDRYKLFWSGADKEAVNGVGIVVSHDLSDKVPEVRRLTEHVMTTKMIIAESIHVIVPVYAPQTGRPENEKEALYDLIDKCVDSEEAIIMGGDFNGHVGSERGI